MILSIIVTIRDKIFHPIQINAFIDRVDGVKYDKGKIEIAFLLKSNGLDNRIIKSVPLIRLYSYSEKNHSVILNDAIRKCVGDVVVVAELDSAFDTVGVESKGAADVLTLEDMTAIFRQRPEVGMIMGYDWFAFRKTKFNLPEDLIDFKTHMIMRHILSDRIVLGGWGALYAREVLRFAYKFDKLRLRQKVRVLLRMRRGT